MKKRLPIILTILVISLFALLAFFIKKPDYSGIVLRVASFEDISATAYAEGAAKFYEKYGISVEFTDDFSNCDLFLSESEDFSGCLPLTDYINPSSKLYSKGIIEQSCSENGEIYGISHALMGNINYCIYRPSQFGAAALPYDYYKKGKWTWDSFILMANEIGSNIGVDWTQSYINMRHALFLDEDKNPTFDYGTQAQVEWLNFVRTLIYDDGIVDSTEGALKVDFLPGAILNSPDTSHVMRFIPWPTKDGNLEPVFVDECHFSVPENAQNPKLSVKLANYMIEAFSETRMGLYREVMLEEDFNLFEKQLSLVYSYPKHTDYVPAREFIEDFIHGKTVTEHIYNVENGAEHIN